MPAAGPTQTQATDPGAASGTDEIDRILATVSIHVVDDEPGASNFLQLLAVALRDCSVRMDAVLIAWVAGELIIARQHLAGLIERRGAAVAVLGPSAVMQAHTGTADLPAWLAEVQARIRLDFLYDMAAADATGAAARWPAPPRRRSTSLPPQIWRPASRGWRRAPVWRWWRPAAW